MTSTTATDVLAANKRLAVTFLDLDQRWRRRRASATGARSGQSAQQRLLDLRGHDRVLLDDLRRGGRQPVRAGVDDGPRHRVVR